MNGVVYHQFVDKIVKDCWYTIKYFKVVYQYGSCRTTTYLYKIIFFCSTKLSFVSSDCDKTFFNFVTFDRIFDGTTNDDYLVGKYLCNYFKRNLFTYYYFFSIFCIKYIFGFVYRFNWSDC